MKKLGLLLLFALFITGVYFSANSTAAVAADEEPEINWSDEEMMPELEPSKMDDPGYYDSYDEEESESDESNEEDASDADQEESGDEESY
jgi:hypothetical protein